MSFIRTYMSINPMLLSIQYSIFAGSVIKPLYAFFFGEVENYKNG